MKIKTRNALIVVLMVISLALSLGLGVIMGFQIFSGDFFWKTTNSYVMLQSLFFIKFNHIAIIASVFASLIFIFTTYLFIAVEFEKTQSSEIIYFSVFLAGFMTENCKLLIPLMHLWESQSVLVAFFARFIIFGRTLSVLSLMFAVLYSSSESRQYIEQNIILITATALLTASLFPLNTSYILPTGHVQFGFGHLFEIFQLIILVISIIALWIKTYLNHFENNLLKGFLLVCVGYFITLEAYNILSAVLGAALLYTGTYLYLKKVHGLYLWN